LLDGFSWQAKKLEAEAELKVVITYLMNDSDALKQVICHDPRVLILMKQVTSAQQLGPL
jgi:hypothetical protein